MPISWNENKWNANKIQGYQAQALETDLGNDEKREAATKAIQRFIQNAQIEPAIKTQISSAFSKLCEENTAENISKILSLVQRVFSEESPPLGPPDMQQMLVRRDTDITQMYGAHQAQNQRVFWEKAHKSIALLGAFIKEKFLPSGEEKELSPSQQKLLKEIHSFKCLYKKGQVYPLKDVQEEVDCTHYKEGQVYTFEVVKEEVDYMHYAGELEFFEFFGPFMESFDCSLEDAEVLLKELFSGDPENLRAMTKIQQYAALLRTLIAKDMEDPRFINFFETTSTGAIGTEIHSAYGKKYHEYFLNEGLVKEERSNLRENRTLFIFEEEEIEDSETSEKHQFAQLTVYPGEAALEELDEGERLIKELLENQQLGEKDKLERLAKIYEIVFFTYNIHRGAAHNALMIMYSLYQLAFPGKPLPPLKIGILLDLERCITAASAEDFIERFSNKEYFEECIE